MRPIPLAVCIVCTCSLCTALTALGLVWPDHAITYPE